MLSDHLLSRVPRTLAARSPCRQENFACPPSQRQLVLEAVARLGHATPEEIGAQVQQTARGVNISTIYRTLELLEQIGMVTHNHLGHGAPTYHLATDADHVHLVCRDCGRITEIGPEAIRPLITTLEERHGFETDVGH